LDQGPLPQQSAKNYEISKQKPLTQNANKPRFTLDAASNTNRVVEVEEDKREFVLNKGTTQRYNTRKVSNGEFVPQYLNGRRIPIPVEKPIFDEDKQDYVFPSNQNKSKFMLEEKDQEASQVKYNLNSK
jgi:hypothetical protein